MKKMLGNRKAVSPVLAVLLLIAIAVGAAVVTYAWVMGFVGTQTQQAGGVLVVDRALVCNTTDGNYAGNTTIVLTVRNTGTGRATIQVIYWDTIPGSYSNVNETFAYETPATVEWTTGQENLDIDPGEVYDIAFLLGKDRWNTTNSAGETFYIRLLTAAGSRIDVSITAPTATWPTVELEL